MSRQILKVGTIACSAIAIYAWSQASEQNSYGCDRQSTQEGTNTSKSTDIAQCTSKVDAKLNTAPERSVQQWSDRNQKLPTTVETVYDKLLQQAQTLANQDQFAQAISKIAGIPSNSRYYEMAQQLQNDWGRELLAQAARSWQKAQLKPAMAMLDSVPPTQQLSRQVAELRSRWIQQARIFERAIAAKNAANWDAVIANLKNLEGTSLYNSLEVQALMQQAMTKLYEPDSTLLQIATADLPTEIPGLE